MFLWVYDYPLWMTGLLFVVSFAAFGVVGLMLFRRYALSWLHRDSHANDMVGFAMSSFAMLYGILLGLMAMGSGILRQLIERVRGRLGKKFSQR